MRNHTKPRHITRTWNVTLYSRYESGTAPVILGQHRVTLAADGQGVISASVDGQDATEAAAVTILNRAKRGGQVQLIEEWRLFPFLDLDLPADLLDHDWPWPRAASTFHEQHARWHRPAQAGAPVTHCSDGHHRC